MNTLYHKVDLFMKLHILHRFKPEQIHWVFSISGGKDSFALCESIREWYETNNYIINASGIYIWQWGDKNPYHFLLDTFWWLKDLRVIDARSCTKSILNNGYNQQAPCRSCSDIRRNFSDIYLEQLKYDGPIIICRGLHMTDMTISILWRLIWYGPGDWLEGKGIPLVHLTKNTYLAKPLCFAREYECQLYADKKKFTPLHCDCPAHFYPSRRDIIEESVRMFYTSPLWEFDVPGCPQYLRKIAGISDISYLKSLSNPGHEFKKNTIPAEYYVFAKNYYLRTPIPDKYISSGPLLEAFSESFLSSGTWNTLKDYHYSCRLHSNPDSLSLFDLRMIGTIGPFWAAISLQPYQKDSILSIQKQIWGVVPDINWRQVYSLLKLYYNECGYDH